MGSSDLVNSKQTYIQSIWAAIEITTEQLSYHKSQHLNSKHGHLIFVTN
jgi:hypothetical protein